ncbi:MAG TPA: BatA domain-containing protein [Longimicrobiales bacterium]
MGLSFLAPAFLLGLAALAVPVLVHLTQRQRKDVVEFPSLMFLERIPYRAVRRQRIRHWALFLLRCLAIVLLAAAFARPFLDRPDAALAPAADAREVVILLDRSWSMGYAGRWEAARAAAERVVAGLGPEDRASLVVFDEAAHEAVPSTADGARLRATLDTLAVGSRATRYAPALRLAARVLAASPRPRREAVLVSDFQRRGWDATEEVRLPAGAGLIPIDVGKRDAANVAVAGVTFRREHGPHGERARATARLVNAGAAPVRGLAVALELDGRAVRSRRVDLPAHGAAAVEFGPFPLAGRPVRGAVRAADGALPADDAFHFVIAPGQAVPVLILDGADPDASLYLRRALEIGEEPGFRVEAMPARRLRPAALDDRAVVILNDAPFPGGAAGRRLRAWVEAGGGLIVALGESSRMPAAELARALLPGTFGAPADREAGGALGRIDFDHPVFEPFAAPRSGDFSSARFWRVRPVAPADSAAVLARFDDGSPALVERRVGRGRVLLWASTLDAFWNDLALQPVFLPFVHRLVRHAAARAEARPNFTVGQTLDVDRWRDAITAGRASDDARATPVVVRTPSGRRIPLEPGAAPRFIELGEHGFYEVREGEHGDGPVHAFAVNVDLAESDPTPLDPQELAAAVTAPGDAAGAAGPDTTPAERERRQRWWWYLLAAALALLTAEPVVASRLARGV